MECKRELAIHKYEPPKVNAPRIHENPNFKDFIKILLKQSTLNNKHIDLLTTDDCMIQWSTVFTSKGKSTFNYELYETFGDSTANKIVVSFYKKKFPVLFNLNAPLKHGFMGNVDILSKLKCAGVRKSHYGNFARKMGFLDYIRALDEEKMRSQSILEDTFEAFIGCLEDIVDNKIGDYIGYGICYEFMKPLLEVEEISLDAEKLYDPKSLVNMKQQKLKKFINISFDNQIREDVEYRERFLSILKITDKTGKLIFTSSPGTGSDKTEAEQKSALNTWKSGIFDRLEKIYLTT